MQHPLPSEYCVLLLSSASTLPGSDTTEGCGSETKVATVDLHNHSCICCCFLYDELYVVLVRVFTVGVVMCGWYLMHRKMKSTWMQVLLEACAAQEWHSREKSEFGYH